MTINYLIDEFDRLLNIIELSEHLKERLNEILSNNNKPTVPQLISLVTKYYQLPSNEAGGSLRVVLHDGNVNDDSVRFSIKYAEENRDIMGALLGKVLLRMYKTQRLKLNFIDPTFM